eukprot:gene9103-1196_t
MRQKNPKYVVMPLVGGKAEDYIKSIFNKRSGYEHFKYFFKEGVKEKAFKKDYTIDSLYAYKKFLETEIQNPVRSKTSKDMMKIVLQDQLKGIIEQAKIEQEEDDQALSVDKEKTKKEAREELKRSNKTTTPPGSPKRTPPNVTKKEARDELKRNPTTPPGSPKPKKVEEETLKELTKKETFINTDVLGKIATLKNYVAKIDGRVIKFSEGITEYDKNKDESLKNKLFEEYEDLNEIIAELKTRYDRTT